MHLSQKDNRKLSPIISRLSRRYDKGDTFAPHISVNDGSLLELDEAKKVANDCIKEVHKFKVEVDSIQYSDKWHKTLYIQIKNHPSLTKISKRLNKTFRKGKTPYSLNPHISLLYKKGLTNKEKKNIADKLEVPKIYLVSNIAVVTVGNVDDWKDYGNWKIVYEKALK